MVLTLGPYGSIVSKPTLRYGPRLVHQKIALCYILNGKTKIRKGRKKDKKYIVIKNKVYLYQSNLCINDVY